MLEIIIPMSVMITGGRNRSDTNFHIHGSGLMLTAMRDKIAAVIAAVFVPWVTATVLMLWGLSPSTSTMPLVISRPVFDRYAIATNSIVDVSSWPTANPP